jgi:hypothetical protein
LFSSLAHSLTLKKEKICWLIFSGLYDITSHRIKLFTQWNYLKSYSCFKSNYSYKVILKAILWML